MFHAVFIFYIFNIIIRRDKIFTIASVLFFPEIDNVNHVNTHNRIVIMETNGLYICHEL